MRLAEFGGEGLKLLLHRDIRERLRIVLRSGVRVFGFEFRGVSFGFRMGSRETGTDAVNRACPVDCSQQAWSATRRLPTLPGFVYYYEELLCGNRHLIGW